MSTDASAVHWCSSLSVSSVSFRLLLAQRTRKRITVAALLLPGIVCIPLDVQLHDEDDDDRMLSVITSERVYIRQDCSCSSPRLVLVSPG